MAALSSVLLSIASCGWASDASDAKPASPRPEDTPPAMRSARTSELFAGPDSALVGARIDSIFAEFESPGSPGCAVAVMEAGEIVFGRGYGLADIGRATPFSMTSAFDAASMAKQFLAFGIALLEQEGRLSLDDVVHRHLPELPDYGAPLTLRHLVHHTSGLRDWDARWLAGRDLDPAMLPGLSFRPGEQHLYDDTGYALLQRIIERVSGESWAAFARRRIFDPLGMVQSGFPDGDPGPLPDRVLAYAPSGDGFVPRMPPAREGFTTTPADLARWDRNFYDARLGGRAVLDRMRTEGRLNDGEPIPYSFGLHTEEYRGLRRQWHGGLAGGYRSQFMRFPDQRTSVLVACNVFQRAEPNALAERVSNIVLADAIAEAARASDFAVTTTPGTVSIRPAAELERLAGIYVNADQQLLRPVRVSGGRLQIRQWITWHDLRPVGDERYRAAGMPLSLVIRRAPDGSGMRVLEEHWDGRRTPAVLAAGPAPRLGTAELQAYTGRFRNDELRVTWTLAMEGGRLQVASGPPERFRLLAVANDVFSDGEYLLVVFHRDSSDRIVGFSAATPRTKNLRFQRQ